MKHRKHVSLSESKPRFFSMAAVFLFAFICFFPNPGLPIGTNTGLQAAQIVALLSLPVVLILGLPKRQTLTVLLLFLPVLLSGLLVMVTDRAVSNEVAFNSIVAMVLVLVVLLPAGKIGHERYIVPLLSGVAWAIVLNAVVGLYQAYWFAQDEAPLVGLYQNPSFANFIDNDPELYAMYVKRPFGLFSEPSAMAASIGPWLILIAGLLLYPKLRQGMTRGTLAQLLLAVVCGVGLILISRSGFTIWLLVGLVLIMLPYLKDRVLRLYRPGNLIVLMALALVGATLVALYFTLIGTRLAIQENSSWSARLASIVWSLTYLGTSPSNMLYGVGPGQSNLILLSLGSFDLPAASSGGLAVTAVWSVVLSYILETGLLGALALVLVLIMILRAIVRSSSRLVGFSCLAVWLAGVIFTTSYLPLLPIWLFLGVLLGWNRIFPVRNTLNSLGLGASLSSVCKGVKT